MVPVGIWHHWSRGGGGGVLGDWSDSVMSLSRWKGNCFKGVLTAESEAATSEREGSTPPREHLTPPPHAFIFHTPHCSHLASSSCMPNAIAITAFSFFFFNPTLPSSFHPSIKVPLSSLFRNYNRSGFRQFDQLQGLHVRTGKRGGGGC